MFNPVLLSCTTHLPIPLRNSDSFPMSKLPVFILSWSFCSLFLSVDSHQEKFVYTKFSRSEGIGADADGSSISLNGVVEIHDSGHLRLTKETRYLIGHAFYPTPLQFKDAVDGAAHSFSTTFAFAIVPKYPDLGGHGFTFVIAPSKELTGALPSQYLGLLNSSNMGDFANHVFAVEFDTVQSIEFRDIDDNHVGIDINNLVSNASAPAAYYADDGKKNRLSLRSGQKIQAWIDYDGVGKVLNVTVSPFSSKPPKPLLSVPLDLSPILHDQMFAGFSASTGVIGSSHYLLGWSFAMNGVAPSLNLTDAPSFLSQHKKKNTTFIIIASVCAVLLLIAAASFLFYRFKNADVIEPWELECGPHRFSYKELKQATKGFRDRELLGFGGFGKVYKGTLPASSSEVAVKRISNESRQGIREFVAEIASIGRLRHRNLVQLQGWCRRRADLLLVYDYMPNGSLDKFLFSDESGPPRPLLSWAQRFRILRGVASALLYLHEEWEHVVIHRDVKASNVLLDAEFNGRLGDFGLAKIYEHGADPSTTRVAGTLGYLAPELTRTGKATTGSDVFSFGALALGVVCGRRPVESKAAPEEMILVDWVWERWNAGRWAEVVDPRLGGDYEREEVEVVIKVGLMCSHLTPAVRPTMRDVVRYLDGGDSAEVPSPPADYEGVGFDACSPSRVLECSIAVGEERTVLVSGSGRPLSPSTSPTEDSANWNSNLVCGLPENASL